MAFVSRQQPQIPERQLVSLVFGDVRGVDFRSDDTSSYRSPNSVNMYRSRLGLWETHPGFRNVGYVGKSTPVWGVHKFTYRDDYGDTKTKVLVHAGSKMYIWENYPEEFTEDNLMEIFSGLASRRTKFAEFQNVLLILDGEALYYFDGEVFDYVSHKATVPQTWTGKSPDASSGSAYNQRNFLSRYMIEGFAADGTATYKLSMKDLDDEPAVIWQGALDPDDSGNTHYVQDEDFTFNPRTGTIVFDNGKEPTSAIAGVEDLYIRYSKTTSGYTDRINKCTEIMTFDNRVFLTGHPSFPNVVFWSKNADFTYYGEIDYSERAGTTSAKIVALQKLQENKFLSIKEDTHQDGAYAIWEQYSLNEDYIAEMYLAASGNSTIGCVSSFAHAVFVDDNVFLSSNGLNAISRNLSVSMERNIEHRSTLIDPKLLAENLQDAIMEQHRGYLYILFPNGHCYIANSTAKTNEVSEDIEYEWAYLENVRTGKGDALFSPTQLVSMNDKELYVCFEDGHLGKFFFDVEGADGSFPSYAYNFDGRAIGEYVDTPFSWFGVQNRFKKLRRKYNDLYCDIRAISDVEVLFHTEKKYMDSSKVLSYKANIFTFNDVDFDRNVKVDEETGDVTSADFTFNTIPPVSFVLKKLKGKRFRRLQIRVRSGEQGRPIIFKSLIVDAYVLTRKIK